MKTTLYIDDRVAAAAKRHAEANETTLTAVVNSALRQYLTKARKPKQAFRLKLRTRDAGPLPGVDLENRDSLHDLMGER